SGATRVSSLSLLRKGFVDGMDGSKVDLCRVAMDTIAQKTGGPPCALPFTWLACGAVGRRHTAMRPPVSRSARSDFDSRTQFEIRVEVGSATPDSGTGSLLESPGLRLTRRPCP